MLPTLVKLSLVSSPSKSFLGRQVKGGLKKTNTGNVFHDLP
jgi:hypothetical protein